MKVVKNEKQTKPKVSRRKEIIKIRAEINEIETKKTIIKINKTKSWFFEKINKIDKPLARQTYHKKRKLQANITDEHTRKNPQLNTSKPNLTTH